MGEASEPETLRFDFYEDPNDDSVIFLYEVCTNEAGFEGHKAGEPFKQFIGGIAEECIESMYKSMDSNTSTWPPSE